MDVPVLPGFDFFEIAIAGNEITQVSDNKNGHSPVSPRGAVTSVSPDGHERSAMKAIFTQIQYPPL